MNAVLRPVIRMDTQEFAPRLRELFRPIVLNKLQLNNRVLMGSIHLNMDEFHDQYQRKARFYALRARGGAGLIVTAGCSPNQAGNTGPEGFCIDTDELIGKHALITDAVHREGGRIALQLLHFGREAFHGKLVSASAIRLDANIFTPKALTEEEIYQTVEDFAAGARRAVLAGYDAIELIFSQGFLVHQFLSPHTNTRQDKWGGSLENRMRFAIEVARRVRETVGPDFALLFRIPCLDLLPNALLPEETVALIEALEPFGIDLLNVSIGWHESDIPTIAMVVPRAGFSPVAKYIKQRFPQLKVCVSNRINDPRLAERLLLDKTADMVSMARPFLADANIVNKARANLFNLINTCIACNQSCLDYVFTGQPVGCSVNPECGDENEGEFVPFEAPMKIAVIGGGLAGMAAALYAAKRGAKVALFERSLELGGQLNMAKRIPKKDEFGETVRYFEKSLAAHDVDIRLGVTVDAGLLERAEWDHIIIATGTSATLPKNINGIESSHVLTFEQVLKDGLPVQYPAVVIGGGGVACDLAKYLASDFKQRNLTNSHLQAVSKKLPPPVFAGAYASLKDDGAKSDTPQITVLQRSSRKFAYKLGRTTRWILMNDLKEANVRMVGGLDILSISSSGVEVHNRQTGKNECIPAQTVILATGQGREQMLEEICRASGTEVSVIGAAAEQDGVVSITTATGSAYRAVQAIK